MKKKSVFRILIVFLLVLGSSKFFFISYPESEINHQFNREPKASEWGEVFSLLVGEDPIVFVEDADNDGFNDILTLNKKDETISVFPWNSTTETWESEITLYSGNSPYSYCVGDANDDGDSDILITNTLLGEISIYLWNASIEYWDSRLTISVDEFPNKICLGDLNADNYNDIVLTHLFSNNISRILWNPSTTNWEIYTPLTIGSGSGPLDVTIGNTNDDIREDLVVIDHVMNYTYIYYGGEGPGWPGIVSGDYEEDETLIFGANATALMIQDATNDGYGDILFTLPSNTVSISPFNSVWTAHMTPTSLITGENPSDVYVGDANNDGFNDIATSNRDGNSISLLLWNDSISSWNPYMEIPVGRKPQSIFIEDVNNDGNNDIITSNYLDNSVSVLIWKPPRINNPPTSNHPGDIETAVGATVSLPWILQDEYDSGEYRIFVNGTPGSWKSWDNNTQITDFVNTSETGIFNYTIQYTDSDGECGTNDTLIITVAELPRPPEIIINSPLEHEFYNSTAPNYMITISRSYDSIWYTIDGGITVLSVTELIGVIDQVEWNKKDDGLVVIRFYANNTEGITGFTEVTVIKHVLDQPPERKIPGYPVGMILSIVGLSLLLILSKNRFNSRNH